MEDLYHGVDDSTHRRILRAAGEELKQNLFSSLEGLGSALSYFYTTFKIRYVLEDALDEVVETFSEHIFFKRERGVVFKDLFVN